MKIEHLITVYLLFSLLFATGCLSRAPQTPIQFYSLSSDYSVSSTDRPPSGISLGILPFESSSAIERRMMYRISPVQVGYYDFHKWVEPPAEMVTRSFCDGLASSGLFSVVSIEGTFPMKHFDWLLSGNLLRFERDQTTERPTAYISMYLQIRIPEKGRRVIWGKKCSSRVPISGESATDFAVALDRGLQEINKKTAVELEKLIHRQN